jgi:hypothetical protein
MEIKMGNLQEKWEIEHSSLYKQSLINQMINKNLTLRKCMNFARQDIVSNLTKIHTTEHITDIKQGEKFCFLARVDTAKCAYDKEIYLNQFKERDFIAFSTITEENVSHYENRNNDFMLAYNVPPASISHIFPCDSNTNTKAKTLYSLTYFPSLWLTLEELNDLTKELQVYNQVTCTTKTNNKILLPKAVLAFNKPTKEAKIVAKKFHIPCVIVHPKENAISYTKDMLMDKTTLYRVSKQMEDKFGISLAPNHFF